MVTRGTIIDNVVGILGDTSTEFRNYLNESFNDMLYFLWDAHDWEFKHKEGSFSTVNGQEIYDLSTSTPSLRSSNDIELMFDTTGGNRLRKVELRDIKINYPSENTPGSAVVYAPWGNTTIHLHNIPNEVVNIKYLYLSMPIEATDDADDVETVCGLPKYMLYVFKKLLLAEGMLWIDETRYSGILQYYQTVLLPKAIQADMKNLENSARFKFWEEELSSTGKTFNDFLMNEVFNYRNDY